MAVMTLAIVFSAPVQAQSNFRVRQTGVAGLQKTARAQYRPRPRFLVITELPRHQRPPSFQCDCRTYSESIGSGASSVFGPNSLWRSRKRTHAFQRRIASSLPAGLKCSAAPKSCSALTVQS